MSDPKFSTPNTLKTLLIFGVSVIPLSAIFWVSSLSAQTLSIPKKIDTTTHHFILSAGTEIPIKYDQGTKILLTKDETLSLTVQVAENITNAQGKILIPNGSEIIGEIRPSGQGSQFFSHKLLIKCQNQTPLETSINAISQVISHVETLIKGINPDSLLKGAILGDMANKLLNSFRDTHQSETARGGLTAAELEVLGGWLLGAETLELVSINPAQDLNLTLQSDLVLK